MKYNDRSILFWVGEPAKNPGAFLHYRSQFLPVLAASPLCFGDQPSASQSKEARSVLLRNILNTEFSLTEVLSS